MATLPDAGLRVLTLLRLHAPTTVGRAMLMRTDSEVSYPVLIVIGLSDTVMVLDLAYLVRYVFQGSEMCATKRLVISTSQFSVRIINMLSQSLQNKLHSNDREYGDLRLSFSAGRDTADDIRLPGRRNRVQC